MRIIIYAAIALIVGASGAHAQSAPIESDAIISDQLSIGLLEPAVGMIRAHGWKCDSVSAMQPFLMSRGFTVTCNRFSYVYEFADRGGNWVVTLK